MRSPTSYYRWSDNDHRFGPFIYARERGAWRPLALVLMSGDENEDARAGCKLRMSAFGHTLIAFLPPLIRPWRRWVDVSHHSWALEAKGYWDSKPREYGFSYSDGHLQVYFGRQTDDSSTEQRWSKFLPWTEWRHVRTSHYDLSGEHYWTEPADLRFIDGTWEKARAITEACPSRTFSFKDFDGEELTARTRIDEGEWRFGTGWFKWLSVFRAPRVCRSLDIRFSNETGKRKGSWKGGTIGHSINMRPGELHEPAFRRYCTEHEMTFGCEVPPTALTPVGSLVTATTTTKQNDPT